MKDRASEKKFKKILTIINSQDNLKRVNTFETN